jgi:hypothetical protein
MDDTGLLARSAFEPYGIPQQQGPSLPPTVEHEYKWWESRDFHGFYSISEPTTFHDRSNDDGF